MDCCGVKSHDEIRGLTELLKLYISRNMDAFSLDVRYCFIVPGGGFMPGRLADVWLTPLPEGTASPRRGSKWIWADVGILGVSAPLR